MNPNFHRPAGARAQPVGANHRLRAGAGAGAGSPSIRGVHPGAAQPVYSIQMNAAVERALIRKIVAGDRAAAEALIRGHQPSLMGYLLRLTGRPEVAEDVAQEAFYRALTHIERYDPRFRFSTWLFTIAKRLYVNANQRLAPSFDSDAVENAGARDSGPIGSPAREVFTFELKSEAGRALEMALGSLSQDQRDAIVLFYQLNWSVDQIGEYLDMPGGTVKSHLHRARSRMREVLERHAEQDSRLREALA